MVKHEHALGPVARRLSATERVLCVEDEHDIADFLRAYFRAAGYDLVHIDPTGPNEVVEAVEKHHPDCLLLDVRLRGFSGLDAYRLLRARSEFAFLPIIIVSAHADPEVVDRRSGGIDGFVGKPFNVNTLADVVRRRIERSRELARTGTDKDLQVMTQSYLDARLADEVAVADETKGSFALGLVRLRTLEAMEADVGDEGVNFVASHLLRTARSMLPDQTVLGLTQEDEVAVIIPGSNADDASDALSKALEALSVPFQFPGGAEVKVDLIGGVAGYPAHAGDVDSLVMAADTALEEAVRSGQRVAAAL